MGGGGNCFYSYICISTDRVIFLHTDKDDKFISDYRKYELDPRNRRYRRNDGRHCIFLEISKVLADSIC